MKLDHNLEDIYNVQIFVVVEPPPSRPLPIDPNIAINLNVATTNTIQVNTFATSPCLKLKSL